MADQPQNYLLRGDSNDPSLLYYTNFEAPDTVFLLIKENSKILLVPQLEVTRAKQEAKVDSVISFSKYADSKEREKNSMDPKLLESFLEDHDVEKLGLRKSFPYELGKHLEEEFEITIEEDPSKKPRMIKTEEEKTKIRNSQKATEQAMEQFRNILRDSKVVDGKLYFEDQVLTSERARRILRKFLMKKGARTPEKIIIACGKDSAEPHNVGSGPLRPNNPIIVDIFPEKENYFGDMTRTFWKGAPNDDMKKVYRTVEEALDRSLREIKAGKSVREVYNVACEVIEEAGYTTLRQDSEAEYGFTHSLGHSLGLELHERPRITDSTLTLKENMVSTVEPGIYLEEKGGVRIEDMIVVTEDGYRRLNEMEKDLDGFILPIT